MIRLRDYTADFYIDKIIKGIPFSFTRWGDGEWFCATGRQGANCDNHVYFPEMTTGLNTALKHDQGYYKAIWNANHGQIKAILNVILPHLEQNQFKVDWVNAGIWEDLAINNDMHKLVEALESRNFIMVSDGNKRDIDIKYADYVEVPPVNCFLAKDKIKEGMIAMTEKYRNPIFGMSASMATNVIVDELYPIIGDRCSMVDFGSIWEPFVGRISRSYHKTYKGIDL